ncbi:P-loop containing nucleoside triphosphate hydrolase protein [Phascolomyces articulosus]|uniref:P-loop containing nucleoside triphosphate hydrolase protein n=1 Tax=Phascolomyces articulosus TaxID=60185 RepID=A0AAD5KVY6_9FUNG|nr:P-loop containing nucleoside triphosphate hydrolase protein [Phascolomyces articulosus]
MDQVARRLGLYSKLEEVGSESPNDILIKTVGELQRLLNTGEAEILELFQAAATEVYPWKAQQQSISYHEAFAVATGNEVIDRILGGGFPFGSITEVVGESSSGKTQLCLQLCLSVQSPDISCQGAAVYLHSEGQFPTVRLDQLAQFYGHKYDMDPDALKRAIHTMYIRDREMQYRALCYQLPVLLARHKNIRVVVIDSISAPYRGDNTNKAEGRFDRVSEICEIGSRLKQLAHKYHVAVIVINQVSDTVVSATPGNNKNKNTNGNNGPPEALMANWMDFNLEGFNKSPLSLFWTSLTKKPVLGKSWETSITTRVRLARSIMTDVMRTRRALFVEFSPLVPRSGCEIVIDEGGVRGKIP